MKRILFINGSLGGAQGNTAALEECLLEVLAPHAECERLFLSDFWERGGHSIPGSGDLDLLELRLKGADGFVFTTGTYWDSWGSPMQRFLETCTEFEGTDLWVGKPAAVLVTMHSVGGKEVLSRLQGVLCTLGLQLPPMSGMVDSLSNHWALKHAATLEKSNPGRGEETGADLWRPEDVKVIGHNLLRGLAQAGLARTRFTSDPEATGKSPESEEWAVWPVDTGDPKRRWF